MNTHRHLLESLKWIFSPFWVPSRSFADWSNQVKYQYHDHKLMLIISPIFATQAHTWSPVPKWRQKRRFLLVQHKFFTLSQDRRKLAKFGWDEQFFEILLLLLNLKPELHRGRMGRNFSKFFCMNFWSRNIR